MSVEFLLSGSALTGEGLDELLAAWAGERELYEEPAFRDGQAFIVGPGSVRGVLLTQGETGLSVRLSAFSSRADWWLAFCFLRRALRDGGGRLEREDGATLAEDDLHEAAAHEAAVRDFCAAAGMVRDAIAQGCTLPLDRFSLPLRPGDVPDGCSAADVPGVEARLAERVARFAQAFSASTIVFRNGVRLAAWARIPTLVGKVHLVAVEGLDQPVPLAKVREVLGERVETAGEDVTFLPGLDAGADAAVIASLADARVDAEAWAREHGAELEAADEADGAPAAEDGDGTGAFEPAAEVLTGIMEGLLQQAPPATLRRKLVAAGHDGGLVDLMMMLCARVAERLLGPDDGGQASSPQELRADLVANGIPVALADMVISAVSFTLSLGSAEEDAPPDDEPPRLWLPR